MSQVLSKLQILLHADTAAYRADMRRATNETKKALKDTASTAGATSRQTVKGFDEVSRASQGFARQNQKTFESLKLGARHLAMFVASAAPLIGLTQNIIATQREFDKLSSMLTTATGSADNATRALSALRQLSSETPFELAEMSRGFAQLVNLGLKPTEEAMRAYANTAAATGNSMGQFIEAVADATTNEFERLKEFGIKTRQETDKVIFTFRGASTEVAKNAEAINAYLIGIGTHQYADAAKTAADTLNGAITHLNNNYQMLLIALNQSVAGTGLKQIAQGLNTAVLSLERFVSSGLLNKTLPAMIMVSAGAFIYLHKTAIAGALIALKGTATAFAISSINAVKSATSVNALSLAKARLNGLMATEANLLGRVAFAFLHLVAHTHKATLGIRATTAALVQYARQAMLAVHPTNLLSTAQKGLAVSSTLAMRGALGLTAGVKGLFTLINRHPLMIMATALVAISVSANDLDKVIEDITDSLGALAIMVSDALKAFVNLGKSAIGWLSDILGASKKTADGSQKAFGGFFNSTYTGVKGFIHNTLKAFDALGAGIRGVFAYSFAKVQEYLDTIQAGWQSMLSWVGLGSGQTHEIRRAGDVRSYIASEYQAQVNNGLASSYVNALGSIEASRQAKDSVLKGFGNVGTSDATTRANAQTASSARQIANAIRPMAVNEKVLEHARRYNYAALEQQYGLPQGLLAAIEMQESKGVATARSSVGAYGAFQFMPATASRFGIRGRESDVGAAAAAAAKYLSMNLRMFGDIDKAIAAYNTGEGNVQKKSWSLIMSNRWAKGETKNYVEKVNAYRAYMTGGATGQVDIAKLNDASRTLIDELSQKFADPIILANNALQATLIKIEQSDLSPDDKADYRAKALLETEKHIFEINQAKIKAAQELLSLTDKQKLISEADSQKQALRFNTLIGDKEYAKSLIDESLKHSLTALNIKQKEELSGLNDYHASQIDKLETRHQLEFETLKLRRDLDDETHQHFFEALNKRHDYERKLTQLNLEKQRFEYDSFHLSELDKIHKKYALERDEIHLTLDELLKPSALAELQHRQTKEIDALKENAVNRLNDVVGASSAFDNLQAEMKERLTIIDDALALELISVEKAAKAKSKIEYEHWQARNQLILTQSSETFASLAGIAKDGLGEQSRLYRAMFAMQQGFAIAEASIALQQALSKGLSKGFPLGLAEMATAAAQGAKIISAIKSVVMPIGQAHDGIMSVPKSGTWNLEKGERVLPKHTARALDDRLNKLDKTSGSKVIIHNYTGHNTEVKEQGNGDLLVTIGRLVDGKINQWAMNERKQGGVLYGR